MTLLYTVNTNRGVVRAQNSLSCAHGCTGVFGRSLPPAARKQSSPEAGHSSR